ncbi:uncharacterized protein LACBIDRAFT_298053 [Laccaria bicolor S238N-H82]|uniref:Cx9C motif-containing protein 4, mitochondrial n=1 Tax=Laccaria bicolor (strain S238N-H82 / ATCC MYA-4686) TaxID=486041 RepID=B0DC55_LACBS|nr:uncharacterized protein LACBIDRAFT_298053 [Laccaria bicolor S238N-H82]EDR07833.1 predicted protein [Laccaria bicolor S238N-H82]|eukprot:XP_001881622.1 predicted protein [Laccaria bicolor S238N-H82]
MTKINTCQTEACDLQSCLNRNTYAPEKCEKNLRSLYECCQRFYKLTEGRGESTSCPLPNVVQRWMRDHPKEKDWQ